MSDYVSHKYPTGETLVVHKRAKINQSLTRKNTSKNPKSKYVSDGKGISVLGFYQPLFRLKDGSYENTSVSNNEVIGMCNNLFKDKDTTATCNEIIEFQGFSRTSIKFDTWQAHGHDVTVQAGGGPTITNDSTTPIKQGDYIYYSVPDKLNSRNFENPTNGIYTLVPQVFNFDTDCPNEINLRRNILDEKKIFLDSAIHNKESVESATNAFKNLLLVSMHILLETGLVSINEEAIDDSKKRKRCENDNKEHPEIKSKLFQVLSEELFTERSNKKPSILLKDKK